MGAYEGEEVVILGTIDAANVIDDWTYVDGSTGAGAARAGHWTATLPTGIPEPWQLFVGGEMYVNARWPDARFDDKSMFFAKNWQHGTGSSVFIDDVTQPSTLVSEGDALAISGLNATGASGILNIKHWFTFSAPVSHHIPGSNSFEYYKQPGWTGNKYRAEHDLYYLENKLEFLSAPTEWFYDRATRRLHASRKHLYHFISAAMQNSRLNLELTIRGVRAISCERILVTWRQLRA